MRAVFCCCILAGGLVAGCAPREAFFRPSGRRAVGRDGYVGTSYRVPPGGSREAEAVAALSPLIRERIKIDGEKKDLWNLAAVIEFRNKRREAITFLPGSVRLVSGDFGERRPDLVTRTGETKALSGPVRIPHWHRASFQARWRLPAGKEAPKKPLSLLWDYRYGGRSYPQKTPFGPADSKLAERSLAGDPTGLVTDVDYHGSGGVPFLMNVPFLGAFFRSDTVVRSRSKESFGTGLSARGTWWPLENEFRVGGSAFREER
jgi:hypothetical protein